MDRACCPHLARASATLTGRRKEATLAHEDADDDQRAAPVVPLHQLAWLRDALVLP